MTGYESYSREEILSIIASMESNLRGEKWASEGTGLRADVARSNVREFERQIRLLRSALSSK